MDAERSVPGRKTALHNLGWLRVACAYASSKNFLPLSLLPSRSSAKAGVPAVAHSFFRRLRCDKAADPGTRGSFPCPCQRNLLITIPCLLHYSMLTSKPLSTRRRELPAKPMPHFLHHRTGAINGSISSWLIASTTRLLRRATNPSMIRDFLIFKAASFQESWISFHISRNSEWERSG